MISPAISISLEGACAATLAEERTKQEQARRVSVIELRNILDAQIRQGNAMGTVAVLHNGVAFDIVKMIYNTAANALVIVSVQDSCRE